MRCRHRQLCVLSGRYLEAFVTGGFDVPASVTRLNYRRHLCVVLTEVQGFMYRTVFTSI